MAPYKFRVRFELSPHHRLIFDGERAEFDLGAPFGVIEFIGRSDDKKISSATELILRRRDGLAEEAAAASQGGIVNRALLLTAARERLGLDFGKEQPKGVLTEHGRRWAATQMGFEGQVLDDQPGLMVYDDATETRFARFGPLKATIGRPLERFLDSLRASLAAAESLSDKQLLALEVYSASQFEQSLRARLLTLVTVVEIIADRTPRSPAALALLQACNGLITQSAVDPKEKEQLLSALRELQTESIGSACRRVIAEHLGLEAARQFASWYRARSELVHSGRTALDVPATIDSVDRLVALLLVTITGVAA